MTTDWPEAVQEYEEHTTWRGGMAPGDLDKWWKEQREAIVKYGPPAIAVLKKMQMDTIEVLNDCQAEMGRQCARAEKAEAELAAERADREGYIARHFDGEALEQRMRAERAEAEVKLLKAEAEVERAQQHAYALKKEVERLRWMLDDLMAQIVEVGDCAAYYSKRWNAVPPGPSDVLADLAARYEKEVKGE